MLKLISNNRGNATAYVILITAMLMLIVMFILKDLNLAKKVSESANFETVAKITADSFLEDTLTRTKRENSQDNKVERDDEYYLKWFSDIEEKLAKSFEWEDTRYEQIGNQLVAKSLQNLEDDPSAGNTVFKQENLDRISTNKTRDIIKVGDEAPDFTSFVYQWDLDAEENLDRIDYFRFYWGESSQTNIPNVLFIVNTIPKNTGNVDFSVEQLYEDYRNSIDNGNWFKTRRNFEQIRSSTISNVNVQDVFYKNITWLKSYDLYDLTSDDPNITEFDLQNNYYSFYVMFLFPDGSSQEEKIPFKLEAYRDGEIAFVWYNNLLNIDVTGKFDEFKARLIAFKKLSSNLIPYYLYVIYSNEILEKEQIQ